MAWMPVAEAAARLGVSERTIWRRIKSATIPSRSEAGRTLVDFDESATPAEGSSTFGARSADLEARGLDDEAMAALVAELGEFRAASEREVLRARRSKRAALTLAAVLMGAVGAGVWYHLDTLARIAKSHAGTVHDLDVAYEQDLGGMRSASARLEAQVATQQAELARLQKDADAQRAALAAIESSRDALQCLVDERLNELSAVLAHAGSGDADSVAQRAELAKTIDELRTAVHQKEVAILATQQQSERIIATLRRHAARSAGMAEGLKIHIDFQQQALARAQTELTELHTLLASAPEAKGTLQELAMRRELLSSMSRASTDALPDGYATTSTAPAWWSETVATVHRWCCALRDRARATADNEALARVD